MVSPQWIESISWPEAKVFEKLTQEAIKAAPEYTEGLLIDRDYEARLHRHYGRDRYWVDELAGSTGK